MESSDRFIPSRATNRAIAALGLPKATLGSSLRLASEPALPMPTRSGDLEINKTKPSIYGHLRTRVRGSKADTKRSTLHATTHEPMRRLVNSAEREDVGDDHAVATGFKEVEPVDFLAGTFLGRFLRARLRAHALSRVEPASSRSGTRPVAHESKASLKFRVALPRSTILHKTKVWLNVLA